MNLQQLQQQRQEEVVNNLLPIEDSLVEGGVYYEVSSIELTAQHAASVLAGYLLALEEVKKEVMSLRGRQVIAYGNNKLPFVVWEGKATEEEKITIYEQAFKDIIIALENHQAQAEALTGKE